MTDGNEEAVFCMRQLCGQARGHAPPGHVNTVVFCKAQDSPPPLTQRQLLLYADDMGLMTCAHEHPPTAMRMLKVAAGWGMQVKPATSRFIVFREWQQQQRPQEPSPLQPTALGGGNARCALAAAFTLSANRTVGSASDCDAQAT